LPENIVKREIEDKWKSYEGNFNNGVKEGFGTLCFSDGTKFKGTFKNNEPIGKGVFIGKDNKDISIEMK